MQTESSTLASTFTSNMIGTTDFLIRLVHYASSKPPKGKHGSSSMIFFDFHVEAGSAVSLTQSNNADGGLLLIGDIYNPRQPEKGNKDVIDSLLNTSSRRDFISALLPLCGEYLLLLKQGDKYSIFPDACAQYSAYVNKHFDTFASRPDLLQADGEVQASLQRAETFNSVHSSFAVNASGRVMLPANYYADLNEKKLLRYFPSAEVKVVHTPFGEAVEKLAAHLKGMAAAISYRAPIALAITAGYDTRLLLSAMEHKDVWYFLYQHPQMPHNHHDIVIGEAIANEIGVTRELIKYSESVTEEDRAMYGSLWRARPANAARIINGDRKHFSKHVMLNGNIGEVARSYFGKTYPVSAPMLAKLIGKKGNSETTEMMNAWLHSFDHDFLGTENVLDLLYWEEKMANWAAQLKMEYRLAGKMISPLNSHRILITLLGVEKKYRTYYHNRLFEAAIAKLDGRLSKFPYNPGLKSGIIKTMVALGVYFKYKDFLNKQS